MLLITLALAALQGLESIPRTPYDRVIELETTAEDPVLIEGKGPCVVLEYEVQFEGTLHVWAESELDLALRVDETQGWLTLGEEHESRYLEIRVTTGMSLLVLVAGVTPETLGRLELHVIASPESGETLRAASEGRHDLAEARRLIREGQREEAGSILRERVKRLIATEGVASSPVPAENRVQRVERSLQIENSRVHVAMQARELAVVTAPPLSSTAERMTRSASSPQAARK